MSNSRNTYEAKPVPQEDGSTIFDTELQSMPETDQVNSDSTPPAEELKIVKFSKKVNIASELTDEELSKIGQKVLSGFEEDKTSMQEWLEQVRAAQKLIKLVKEPKNYPLPKSANIKFPLITNACSQFAARTYPEIIKDGKVVKAAVIGTSTPEKEAHADRISKHMSYQLLYESTEWEQILDRLLSVLPNVGFLCKKTYYDPLQGRNRSELCDFEDLIINNMTTSLKAARRISHVLHVYVNDLVEASRANIFHEENVKQIVNRNISNELDKPIDLIEQHRYLDLDEDGYEEPYIVTVTKDEGRVLRIVARFTTQDIKWGDNDKILRINPVQYFTDFHFLPSPDGKFISMGFGTLMLHLNESVNIILNELIDAGNLANLQGGFIDARLKFPSGQTGHVPGEWIKTKGVGLIGLKEGIVPLSYKEPSGTLFQLLGLLIDAGKDLSSSTEVLSGTQPAQNVPATTILALVEQGMKVFNSIQRRLYRSLKDEYQKIFKLNSVYLDPQEYITILDDNFAISQYDYDSSSIDILPIADPNLSSDAQRLGRIQALMNIIEQPDINKREILKRYLEALNIANPELILPEKDPKAPPPLDAIELQASIEDKAQKLNLKERDLQLKEEAFKTTQLKAEAEISLLRAEAVKAIADAEAAESGNQLSQYQFQLDAINAKLDATFQHRELEHKAMQQMLDQKNVEAEQQQNAQPQGGGMAQ